MKHTPTFLIRKVGKRTHLSFGERCAKELCTEYTTLFLRKLLRFQRTFHEKSFGRGLGRIAPTDYAHTKNTAYAVFFVFYKILRSFLYIVWLIKPPHITFAVIILAQLFIIPLSLNITGSSSSSILSIFPSQ